MKLGQVSGGLEGEMWTGLELGGLFVFGRFSNKGSNLVVTLKHHKDQLCKG